LAQSGVIEIHFDPAGAMENTAMINESDFTLSDAQKNAICGHLTPQQKHRALTWLGSYASWKTSPVALYKTFPPCLYRTLAVTARGDDEIWVYCHHTGLQTGGNYMGVAPKGQEINVQWFSIVTFRGSKILRIFSIADVLGMFVSVGVIDPKMMPVDPYK
jgi:hypothetical protein